MSARPSPGALPPAPVKRLDPASERGIRATNGIAVICAAVITRRATKQNSA